ncbi:MAG TPA: family 20 glycosylhydrolase [Bryobacteraceae bacterium]|nr:family 20 glycosylhydrolase [Bryobacteraceae bacterium]
MPVPAQVTPGQGELKIEQTFRISLTGYTEPRLERAAQRLIRHIERKTGMPLPEDLLSDSSQATLEIRTARASETVQKLGEDESYTLDVTPSGAHVAAATPLGALRGMETFVQLIETGTNGFLIPAVHIEDRPRFPWRGLSFDVARHWMPIDVVERTLDGMAAVKLNVFHWHLSDDQGFRVECKTFPKLHQLGSDGRYYTQDQVREIIAYARERGIRVVPEFDMPGHTTAWFAGYPVLASAPGPYSIERKWGIFDPTIDPTRDEVYQFLDQFIGEMAALFPDEYFHIGGDEVNGKQWSSNPRIQAFLRDHGLKDNAALQAYFNRRLQPIVRKHGKKVIGWDEIFDPSLPKDIVIQSWRGQKSLAEAARLGYSGILSAGYYLDLMKSAAFHYAVDPLENETASLDADQKGRILGGEAAMWVEYATPENIDMRLWPRLAAIAERFWSPENVKDTASMYRRLASISRELERLGLAHRSSHRLMLERLAGDRPVAPLSILSAVLEPVKEYSREKARQYTQFTPLNRLVDATFPESDTAREFRESVDCALSGGNQSQSCRSQVMAQLEHWRANDAALRPVLQGSFLLEEVVPVAETVAGLAQAGIEALDYLAKQSKPPESWTRRQMTLMETASQPHAELLILIAPPVQKLVEAASNIH